MKVPEKGFCEVPWNAGTVVSVMFLWFASFMLVGPHRFAVGRSLARIQL